MPRPPVGGAGGYPPPRVLEIEFETVPSGYLNHRLTQDVGIDLGGKEGIMDGERAPPCPLDHPGHNVYGHIRVLVLELCPAVGTEVALDLMMLEVDGGYYPFG